MESLQDLSKDKINRLQQGKIFVPSPLALDDNYKPIEKYQRLLTLYYIRSGAVTVVPGAHTGEFALNDLSIFDIWLDWVKEMTMEYGQKMILMAAVGGENVFKQAELASKKGYDIIMVSPTAFSGIKKPEVIRMIRDLASIIPVFGFELQRAIPGAYEYDMELWEKIFEIAYGAKGASFDTYRSMVMLEAAARAKRKDRLTMLTGNDDRIVTDLLGKYDFEKGKSGIRYNGGLLGHWATDTKAAKNWVDAIFKKRESDKWIFPLSLFELAHAVNQCNMVLFDALGNFENSVWGVKYRLTKLGLLPSPVCKNEKGRRGQPEAIDRVYGMYPELTDEEFLKQSLPDMKKEMGIK